MATSPGVKLLTSSRHENAFVTSFKDEPTLFLEQFTRPDISNYVCKIIRTDTYDDYDADQIRRIQDHIVRHARGVFLWVFLTVSIVTDGLSNSEDIAMIRRRIEKLPQELDDLFTHILRKRIPDRYKTEAFRYIWIVLECQKIRDYWPGLSAQRWDGDVVPDVALAIAQQAQDTKAAATLARMDPQSIQKQTERLRSHLHSRCQGLLELSNRNSQNPERTERKMSCVYFLHRTLYDYLTQHSGILELLKTEVGEHFDVNRAMMTGWIAYHKVQPTKSALQKFAQLNVPIIFRLNALAEKSTGEAQSKLLTVIDEDMTNRVAPISKRRSDTSHWASDFTTGADLLAYTIATGSSQYLQKMIDNDRALTTSTTLRPLLQFAIPEFSVTARRRDDAINLEAAVILLMQKGENPLTEFEGCNAWRNAFTWITKDPAATKSASLMRVLAVIRLMINNIYDLNKRRATLGNGFTPAGVIGKRVLAATCCLDKPVHVCGCPKAKDLVVAAEMILQTLEFPSKTPYALERSRSPSEVGSASSLGAFPRPPESYVDVFGHNRSRSRTRMRTDSNERMFRPAHRNVRKLRRGRSSENTRENFWVSEGYKERDLHHLRRRDGSDPDMAWSDSETLTRSRKGFFTARPTSRSHSTHPDGVIGNSSRKQHRARMTSTSSLLTEDRAMVPYHRRPSIATSSSEGWAVPQQKLPSRWNLWYHGKQLFRVITNQPTTL